MSTSLISVAKRPSIRVPKKVIHFSFMVKKNMGKILILYFIWHVFKQCINVRKSLMIACHSSTILFKFLTTAIPSICNQKAHRLHQDFKLHKQLGWTALYSQIKRARYGDISWYFRNLAVQEYENVCLRHINLTSYHELIKQAHFLFFCSYRLILRPFNHAGKIHKIRYTIQIIFGLRLYKEIPRTIAIDIHPGKSNLLLGWPNQFHLTEGDYFPNSLHKQWR